MPSRSVEQPNWWETALVDFRPRALLWLRRGYPTIAGFHEDVVSEAIADVIDMLRRRKADLTLASWYETGSPPKEEEESFHRLAFAILRRRVTDHYRMAFRRWTESLEDHPETQEWRSDDPMPDEQLEASRVARSCLRVMAQMPARDRKELEQVALGGSSSPMNEKERQRLRRLRVRLLDRLREELGEDPIAFLRQI